MEIKQGHVAVITGAGGGLGSALARDLAERGCNLALVDISEAALEATKASLSGKAKTVTTYVVDVTSKAQMKKLAKDVVADHSTVNLLINNAGITIQKLFSTHTLADWERMVGINLWGVIYGLHFFDQTLTEAQDAHVVNLSSMSAFMGLSSQSSYCATKSAVQGLTESIWSEWAVKGIGVTCVHPGAIRTDMIKATLELSDDQEGAMKNYDLAHKIGIDADKAAAKILKAVEKNKFRIRIGREAFLMDYLKRLMPSLIHRPFLKVAKEQTEAAYKTTKADA